MSEDDLDGAIATFEEIEQHHPNDLRSVVRLGFLMFREYSPGREQTADVDSGPIIWGAGIAATGLGVGAARAVGDIEMATDLESLVRLAGLPRVSDYGHRPGLSYLFGKLPIGDAFLAWGRSLSLRPEPAPQK